MKGAYKTKAREEIISFLKEHTEQRFTAKEILEAIAKQADGINKTTVYRNLDRLCETSGKTTLMQNILKQEKRKIALIVNDMGSINIDASLLNKTGNKVTQVEMVEMQNGCIYRDGADGMVHCKQCTILFYGDS